MKKQIKENKGYTVVLRLTAKEKEMARKLRDDFNVNISGLMRSAIRDYYEKMGGE